MPEKDIRLQLIAMDSLATGHPHLSTSGRVPPVSPREVSKTRQEPFYTSQTKTTITMSYHFGINNGKSCCLIAMLPPPKDMHSTL
jgi:hypothetical protein